MNFSGVGNWGSKYRNPGIRGSKKSLLQASPRDLQFVSLRVAV